MGFAAGFAAGYEAVDKGRREEEARKKQIDDEAKKLKEEQDKVFNSAGQEIASHNKLVSDLTINMAKAEDETQYNTYASELKAANDNFTSLKAAKLDNYKDTPLAVSLDKLYSNARMSSAEQVVQTDIKDYNGKPVTVYLPESIANNKDSAILMENGKVGLAGDNNIGADGKITGYNPTNITPIKFKTPEINRSFGVINGKEGFYTDERLANATEQGMSVERSKDKPAITKVEVKVGDKGKDYANIATDARTKLKNIESNGKLTPDDESNLMASEFTLTETMDTKQKDKRQEVRDTLDTVQNLKEIKNTTKRLMDSGVKGGIAQDAVVGVMKYVGTGGKFSDLTDMDDAKFKSITGLEAASTAQKMEIIRSLSGLSYTDKQAEMMNKITGDGWGKTNEAKYNAMNGYINDQERKLKGIASTNNTFSSTSPYTSAMVLKTLGGEATAPKVETPAPPVNDYEKIAKEQGKVYDPANYEYGLVDGVLKQKLIKKGN